MPQVPNLSFNDNEELQKKIRVPSALRPPLLTLFLILNIRWQLIGCSIVTYQGRKYLTSSILFISFKISFNIYILYLNAVYLLLTYYQCMLYVFNILKNPIRIARHKYRFSLSFGANKTCRQGIGNIFQNWLLRIKKINKALLLIKYITKCIDKKRIFKIHILIVRVHLLCYYR